MQTPLLIIVLCASFVGAVLAREEIASDVLTTSAGDLKITFVGHATLVFTSNGKVIHVDPDGKLADYSRLPKADVILITHDHFDHFDVGAIRMLSTTNTTVVLTAACSAKLGGGLIMKNGDTRTVQGIGIEAVPAYNITHKRPDGQPFHPWGVGNGYVLAFGDRRVYVAGDTENTPEMKTLKRIDIAFLPMNLPYTMTPEMVADAAKSFMPKILYPYHYGDTDPAKLKDLLKESPQIEVRIRQMQ